MRRIIALCCLLPTLAAGRLLDDDPEPLGDRLPVILLHGWNADQSTFDEFLARARQRPEVRRRCKLYRFVYDWSRPIAVSADTLRGDLAARGELAGRCLALVGHSMGGLVARTYAETRLPGWDGLDRVGALITLGTPHHGSPMANLEWLAGDSRYSVLTGFMPLGLIDQLNRLDVIRASRTLGGRDLGFDNYDQSMPEDLWSGANKFCHQLNANLALHPERDELLRRYSFHAGYLDRVPSLTRAGFGALLRREDPKVAGAAMLAHAFKNQDGQVIQRWLLNDGVVPLDSALCLTPGPFVALREESVRLRRDVVEARLPRPGILGSLSGGVDHSRVTRDKLVVDQVLQQLLAVELNGLVVDVGGRPALYRPGSGGQPEPLAGSGRQALAAPRGDRLVVQAGTALEVVGPTERRTVARGRAGDWLVAPDGALALGPDGALVGLTRPAYRPLGEVSRALWSPDGRRLAWLDAAGGLQISDTGELLARPGRTAEGAGLTGLTPVAWAPDGSLLLAAREGVSEAVWRPDGRVVALVGEPGSRVVVLGDDGLQRGEWSLPAEGPRLCLLTVTDGATSPVAEGSRPVWSPDGAALAWLEAGGVGVWSAGRGRRLEGGAGATDLLFAATGALLVTVDRQPGTGVLVWLPGETALRQLTAVEAAPAGALAASPDGRWVSLPLTGELTLVSALDGSSSALIPGRRPLWLPQPVARSWGRRQPALP